MDWVASGSSGGSSSPDAKKSKKEAKQKKEKGGGGGRNELPPHYRAAMAQICRLSRDVEILKACNYLSCKAPATNELVVAGLRAGKDYSAAVRGNPQHKMGKPHCHVFGAMVNALLKELEAGVTSGARADLQPSYEVVKGFCGQIKKAQDLEDKVFHCVIRVQYKKDTVKIEWHVTNHTATLSEIMMNALKYSGAEQYLGAGPKNPNERKIGNFLSKKKGEEEDSDEE